MALYSEDKFPNLGNICVICANSVVISSGWEGAEKHSPHSSAPVHPEVNCQLVEISSVRSRTEFEF